jgi:hypothetical protein
LTKFNFMENTPYCFYFSNFIREVYLSFSLSYHLSFRATFMYFRRCKFLKDEREASQLRFSNGPQYHLTFIKSMTELKDMNILEFWSIENLDFPIQRLISYLPYAFFNFNKLTMRSLYGLSQNLFYIFSELSGRVS